MDSAAKSEADAAAKAKELQSLQAAKPTPSCRRKGRGEVHLRGRAARSKGETDRNDGAGDGCRMSNCLRNSGSGSDGGEYSNNALTNRRCVCAACGSKDHFERFAASPPGGGGGGGEGQAAAGGPSACSRHQTHITIIIIFIIIIIILIMIIIVMIIVIIIPTLD